MPRGLMKLLTHQTTNGPLTECTVAISRQGLPLLKLAVPAHHTAWHREAPLDSAWDPRAQGAAGREGQSMGMLQEAALLSQI